MQKIAIGLSALVLIAATTTRGVAQDASPAATRHYSAGCMQQVADYFGCLEYGVLTQAQARTVRGHPLFLERQTATAFQAPQPSAAPDRTVQASRIVGRSHQ